MKRGPACTALLLLVWCAGCRSPREPQSTGDAIFRNHMLSGATAHSEGDAERAEHAYRAALTRAELTDRAESVRKAAQNLAVVRLEAGAWEEAQILLQEAAAHADTPASLAGIRVLQARCDIQGGAPDRARRTLEALLADPAAGAAPSAQSRARLLLAELAVRTGDMEEARAFVAARPDVGTASESARWHRVMASLAAQDGDADAAAAAREQEAAAWQEAGDWRFMALALEQAGNQWLAAGHSVRAVEVWLRAARSLAAQSDRDRAWEILQRCRQSSQNDLHVMSRVQRLLTELETTR